jgi:hypothetical protein
MVCVNSVSSVVVGPSPSEIARPFHGPQRHRPQQPGEFKAYVRKKYAIDPPDEATRDDGILTLAQATQHSGVSDTTLRKLIQEKILAVEQVAPCAPLEINRRTTW